MNDEMWWSERHGFGKLGLASSLEALGGTGAPAGASGATGAAAAGGTGGGGGTARVGKSSVTASGGNTSTSETWDDLMKPTSNEDLKRKIWSKFKWSFSKNCLNIHYLLISRCFLCVFLHLSFQGLLWVQTRDSGVADLCGCRFLALPLLSTEKDEKIKSKWTQILTSQEPSRALTPVSPSRADSPLPSRAGSPLPSRANSRLDSPLTDSPLATETGMCNTVPCVEHNIHRKGIE